MKATWRLLLGLFFCSGATGLVYEVLWNKQMGFVFGNSMTATSTVLAAFMGGLALGSILAARWVDRFERPILAYGVIEAAVGLYCASLPYILPRVSPWLAQLYHLGSPNLFAAARFGLIFALLLLPSTLMGMTFPLLGAHAARCGSGLGKRIGFLYGANSFGAVLGAVLASFLLVPNLGLGRSALAACAVNLIILLAAIRLDRLGHGRSSAIPPASTAKQGDGGQVAGLLPAFAVAGAASMVYQVGWTRVFSLLVGSSVYSFSLMLAAFIGGLALGSILAAPRLDRIRNPWMTLAKLELAIALSGFALTAAFSRLPLFFAWLYPKLLQSFPLLCVAQFACLATLLLVPTTLIGALFPLVGLLLARESKTPGQALGRVYGANTAGCIVGALAGGFLLVPLMGLRNTLMTASMANLALALYFALRSKEGKGRRGVTLASALTLACLACLIVPSWNPAVLTCAPYVYASFYANRAQAEEGSLRSAIEGQGEYLFHEEGQTAVVSVRRAPDGVLSLHVNGKTDASTNADMKTQVLISHLPALFAVERKRALAVGLGCGASLGAFQKHPFEAIDCIEISPEIVRAAGHFEKHTGHDLRDPRVNMVVDDGRTWLAMTEGRFDAIMSQPSNPWISGMSYLFTREYFELCRSRLAEGGVMCAWVQAYAMATEDVQAILATFRSVFPNCQLWASDGAADYVLLGMDGGQALSLDRMSRRWTPTLAKDLARFGIRGEAELLDHFLGGATELARLAQGGRIVTDDNLSLEYSAPRHLYEDDTARLRSLVAKAYDAAAFTRSFSGPLAARHALRAKERLAAVELRRLGIKLARNRAYPQARATLEEALRLAPSAQTRTALLNVLHAQGSLAYGSESWQEAAAHYRRMTEVDERSADGWNNLGNALFRQRQLAAARDAYLEATRRAPELKAAWKNLGVACHALRSLPQAITAFEHAAGLGTPEAAIHNNLGILYMKDLRYKAAAGQWKKALQIDMACQPAQQNLQQLRDMGFTG